VASFDKTFCILSFRQERSEEEESAIADSLWLLSRKHIPRNKTVLQNDKIQKVLSKLATTHMSLFLNKYIYVIFYEGGRQAP